MLALAPPIRNDMREPLYDRFRKHHPPTFEGRTNLLRVEQWLGTIPSILDFIKVEGNDRVACASHMLREDSP